MAGLGRRTGANPATELDVMMRRGNKGHDGKEKGRTTGPAISHTLHLRTERSNNVHKVSGFLSPTSHQFWGRL
jgi:hypothetical protein